MTVTRGPRSARSAEFHVIGAWFVDVVFAPVFGDGMRPFARPCRVFDCVVFDFLPCVDVEVVGLSFLMVFEPHALMVRVFVLVVVGVDFYPSGVLCPAVA